MQPLDESKEGVPNLNSQGVSRVVGFLIVMENLGIIEDVGHANSDAATVRLGAEGTPKGHRSGEALDWPPQTCGRCASREVIASARGRSVRARE